MAQTPRQTLMPFQAPHWQTSWPLQRHSTRESTPCRVGREGAQQRFKWCDRSLNVSSPGNGGQQAGGRTLRREYRVLFSCSAARVTSGARIALHCTSSL